MHSVIFSVQIFLDNMRMEGINYAGFPLLNYAKTSFYSRVTVEECQYLCEISDLCRYFIYNDNGCYLYFGVGEKVSPITNTNTVFGNKYSSGIRRDIIS